MKKYIFLILSLVTCHLSLFSQSGTITNIQVSQRIDGSGLTDVYFALSGAASAYYISVEASFNSGSTFTPIPAGSTSGDTGPIIAGSGKHIIWNGLQSSPNTYTTQAKLNLTASTTPPPGSPCPGMPTVVYGGQTYNTVQVGTQCWFKENLNIGTKINAADNQTNNSIIEKYCYNDLVSNCNIYGGLYQWNEMMAYVTTPGVKGICPTGWHIPTDGEWCTLTQFLDPTVNCGVSGWSGTNAGGKMKSTGTIQAGTGLWNIPNTGATNESGLTAVPAGYRATYGLFNDVGYYGFWWSSSEFSSNNARYRVVYFDGSNVYSYYYTKSIGFSVRCVQN